MSSVEYRLFSISYRKYSELTKNIGTYSHEAMCRDLAHAEDVAAAIGGWVDGEMFLNADGTWTIEKVDS